MKMKWIKGISLAALPLLPVVMRFAYNPIDRGFTVKRLGCGCHPGFNANVFNILIMCPIVVAISAIVLVLGSRVLKGNARWLYLAPALVIHILVGFWFWRQCLWL